MPIPEEWRWLSELPDEWEPPEDLMVPTDDPGANLAIRMLSDELLGHDCRALVGRWITERALLSMWFLVDRRGIEGNLRLDAELSLLDNTHQPAVYDAWSSRSGLAETLQAAVRALASARGAEPSS